MWWIKLLIYRLRPLWSGWSSAGKELPSWNRLWKWQSLKRQNHLKIIWIRDLVVKTSFFSQVDLRPFVHFLSNNVALIYRVMPHNKADLMINWQGNERKRIHYSMGQAGSTEKKLGQIFQTMNNWVLGRRRKSICLSWLFLTLATHQNADKFGGKLIGLDSGGDKRWFV